MTNFLSQTRCHHRVAETVSRNDPPRDIPLGDYLIKENSPASNPPWSGPFLMGWISPEVGQRVNASFQIFPLGMLLHFVE